MNKHQLLNQYYEFLEEYGISKKDCTLIWSAALVMHGKRNETKTIDIEMAPEVYQRLKQNKVRITRDDTGGEWMRPCQEIWVREGQTTEVILVDGVYVQNMLFLKYTKESLKNKQITFS